MKQGRIVSNPLAAVGKVETRGREVHARRAYSDDEVKALLNVAGKYRLPCLVAALTGLRHGELKRLRWGDLNLSAEKPSVTVRASISKNHKQACLPLHPVVLAELLQFRPVDAAAGTLVFPDMLPRPDVFNGLLKKAGIVKVDSQGRVVDFHSLRHTFCTNLHRAGVPQREAMELMRHNDPRLTSNTYADASLFALREAVERLPWDDAQRDAQKSGASGLLPSSSVTVGGKAKSEKTSVEMGLMSVSVTGWHEVAKTGEWCAIEGSNL
jgi:integrase